MHLDPGIRMQWFRPDDRILPNGHRRTVLDRIHQIFRLEVPFATLDLFVRFMMLYHHLVTLLILIRIAHVLIVPLPVPLNSSLLAVAFIDARRKAQLTFDSAHL